MTNYDPYSPDIIETVKRIIETINSNPLLPKEYGKTLYERILELFLEKGTSSTSCNEVEALLARYGNVSDTYKRTRNLMSNLREKLLEEGYSIASFKGKNEKLYYLIVKLPTI